MKTYIIILLSIMVSTGLTSCNEETVAPFSAETGINFLEPTGSDNDWGTGYANLSYTGDFFAVYEKGIYGQETNEFQLKVALEGHVASTPQKVKFMVEPVDGYETPEIIVPSNGIEIAAGQYTADVVFTYKKPAKYNTEYRANIIFDYDHSDVVAGTKERQKFLVIVKNAFTWSSMYVETQEEWDRAFTSVLGPFGEEKVRFLTSVFANIGASLSNASYYTYYDYYADRYGLQAYLPQVTDALNEYNAQHPDAPLQETDGTPVTFPEP